MEFVLGTYLIVIHFVTKVLSACMSIKMGINKIYFKLNLKMLEHIGFTKVFVFGWKPKTKTFNKTCKGVTRSVGEEKKEIIYQKFISVKNWALRVSSTEISSKLTLCR